jgi:hypothetical protein
MARYSEPEENYYAPIARHLDQLFRQKGVLGVHFETTANKKFSNQLKSKISDHRHIIFSFLKEVAPDITGFITKGNLTDFVVVEIKNEEIKLDHIYQTRKYAELFDAKFAFLVSSHEIPEEIKRLSKVVSSLLQFSYSRKLFLGHFSIVTNSFHEWHLENPFENDYYWK